MVKTGSGDHPLSYSKGTGAFSQAVKLSVREAANSPPTSAKIKKTWIYKSTLPYVFMEFSHADHVAPPIRRSWH
jgi:hypothetical protein